MIKTNSPQTKLYKTTRNATTYHNHKRGVMNKLRNYSHLIFLIILVFCLFIINRYGLIPGLLSGSLLMILLHMAFVLPKQIYANFHREYWKNEEFPKAATDYFGLISKTLSQEGFTIVEQIINVHPIFNVNVYQNILINRTNGTLAMVSFVKYQKLETNNTNICFSTFLSDATWVKTDNSLDLIYGLECSKQIYQQLPELYDANVKMHSF